MPWFDADSTGPNHHWERPGCKFVYKYFASTAKSHFSYSKVHPANIIIFVQNTGRDIVLISPEMTNWQSGCFHLIIGDILVAMWSNGLICNNYQTREGIRFLNVEHAPAWLRMLIILQRICVN